MKNEIKIFRVLNKKIRTLWRLMTNVFVTIYNFFFNRPIGYIYMFHMVKPKGDYIAAIDSLRVSPECFEKFLAEKKKRVDFISIDEVPTRIKAQRRGQKPFAVITFDDGYEDNFIYAYPILKKLQIPFVIYISVGLVNDHLPIWNYPLIIERIIRKNTMLRLGNGETYVCATEKEKNETFGRLKKQLFSLPYKLLRSEFEKLFDGYLTDDVFPKNTLTWKQIEQLAKDSLCTIGSHTMSHCRLVITDEESLSYELGNSKKILEQHTGLPIVHMSYPYGTTSDVSDEAKQYVGRIGYKTALLSGKGPVREIDTDMYSLKRIIVEE